MPLATDKYPARVGCLFEVTVELSWLTMTYSNKAMTTVERTHDGVIVVAAFVMVLVSVIWVGVAVALRCARSRRARRVAWSRRLSWKNNNRLRVVFGRRGNNDGQRLTQRYRRRIRVDMGVVVAAAKVDSGRHREKSNEKRDTM